MGEWKGKKTLCNFLYNGTRDELLTVRRTISEVFEYKNNTVVGQGPPKNLPNAFMDRGCKIILWIERYVGSES